MPRHHREGQLWLLYTLSVLLLPCALGWKLSHTSFTPQGNNACPEQIPKNRGTNDARQRLYHTAVSAAETDPRIAADCMALLVELEPKNPGVLFNYAVYLTSRKSEPGMVAYLVSIFRYVLSLQRDYGHGDVHVQLASLLPPGSRERIAILEAGLHLLDDIDTEGSDSDSSGSGGTSGEANVVRNEILMSTYLGNEYTAAGRHVHAAALFDRIIDLDPKNPIHYLRYGTALRQRGEKYYHLIEPMWTTMFAIIDTMTPEQLAAVGFTLDLLTKAHDHFGSILRMLGREPKRSEEHHRHALRYTNNYGPAYNNLGNLYKDHGDLERASRMYEQAAEHHSVSAVTWGNIAGLAFDVKNYTRAVHAYRRALQLDSSRVRDKLYLMNAKRYAAIFDNDDSSGGYDEGAESAEELFTTILDRANASMIRAQGFESSASNPDAVSTSQAMIAMLLPVSTISQRRIADLLATQAALERKAANRRSFKHTQHDRYMRGDEIREPGGRIRVGYLSPNFGDHPVALCVQDLFTQHDAAHFEVFAYATSADDDSVLRHTIQSRAEHFIELSPLNMSAIADRIHSDGIDILVDLAGYTRGSTPGVLAYRPAHVHALLMGYTATMGTIRAHGPTSKNMHTRKKQERSLVDYMIGDTIVTPPVTAHDHAERLSLMPRGHSYFTTHHAAHHEDVVAAPLANLSRKEYGLPESGVLYCSFNRAMKVSQHTLSMWRDILLRVPSAYLWLLDFPPRATSRVVAHLIRAGVRKTQVIVTPRHANNIHIHVKSLCDVFLDTPGWNAHTTAADVLWAGVPIVTWPQRRMASRVALSLVTATLTHDDSLNNSIHDDLHTIEQARSHASPHEAVLSHLHATSRDDYVEKAVRLGTHTTLRREVTQAVRQGRTRAPLFDTNTYTRALEARYTAMWTLVIELGLRNYHLFS